MDAGAAVGRTRDAVIATAGVLREAGRLAGQRLWDRGDRPRRAADATPAWLTRALQAEFPGLRVRSVEPVDQHAGTTDRARLRITYDDPGTGAPPPPSLFVKTAPPDVATRLFVNLMRLGVNEVRFYREIAPAVPIEHPRMFHADAGGAAQRFVLVLEDLAARGADFADVETNVTLEQAPSVMRELARLHARFWDSPRLRGDLAWLRAPDRRPHAAVERCLCAAALAPAQRRFPDVVPVELRTVAPRIMAARDAFEAVWARGPLTVVHGDAHIGNLYFLPGTVGFLDWQLAQCCQGMRDVAYFLIGSLSTELRRAHQHDLIASYLATLRAQGAAAPAFEEAWLQYRLHAPWFWIAAVVTAAFATLQSESIARTALARSCAALVELDSLGALASAS